MSTIAALVLVLLVTAWLTAAAITVRVVSRLWLRRWVERRLSGDVVAEEYLDRPQRLLATAGAATALVTLAAGALLAEQRHAGLPALLATGAAFVLAALVVGQIVPRALARRRGPRLAWLVVPPLRALAALLAPVLALGHRAVVPFVGRTPTGESAARERLRQLLRESALEGVGEREELAIIGGVVDFGALVLRDVMTPRERIVSVDDRLPAAEQSRRVADASFSRVPVVRGSLDDVLGMIHAFDVLKTAGSGRPPVRPVWSGVETMRCDAMLAEMLRRRMHLAIVRNAAGRTVGLVTLEDLLQRLVTAIRNEPQLPVATTPAAP